MTTTTKPKMKWRNFWICFSISLGQVAFGYPSSIIGTTLGQPAFLLYMGLITPEGLLTHNANNLIGATSGVFQVLFCILMSQVTELTFASRQEHSSESLEEAGSWTSGGARVASYTVPLFPYLVVSCFVPVRTSECS